MPQTQPNQQDPVAAVNAFIKQITSSPDGKQLFDQFVSQNPAAQSVMPIVQQYGNGDLRTAFINYAAANGKQALAQEIAQRFGLV